MKKRVCTMLALLVSQVALGATIEGVSPSQAAQMQQSNEAVILDVREMDEWNAGHIAGAIHIPLGEMQGRMSEIARYKNSSVITQCRSGTRSEKAAQALKQAGFSSVYNLEGGINAWQKADLAIEQKAK